MKSAYPNLLRLVFLIIVSAFVAIVSGCQSEKDKQTKLEINKQQREERRLAAQEESEKKIEEALTKGSVLLSKTTAGDVVIETYEIPRPRYLLGSRFGLTKDICVVYTKRGSVPVMSCYLTENFN
jgi:hypothetical protein